MDSFFHPQPPVSRVSVSGRRVGQRPRVCLKMVAVKFFFFFFLYRPNETHVAWVYSCIWMEFFFYYCCKYRNCNPVIKWNMTDFLQKKPLFLQCPFSGCWDPFISTRCCRVQSCFMENLFSCQFLLFHFSNKEFIALFPPKKYKYILM